MNLWWLSVFSKPVNYVPFSHHSVHFTHCPVRVSLKHDGTDGTVKMANLPVPSVCDRRDSLSCDRRDSENGQSACPVIVWQRGQELNEKRETKLKSVILWKYTYFRTIITKMWLVCESKLGLPNDFVLIYCFLPININFFLNATKMYCIILHKRNSHAAMVQSQHWYNDNINSYTSVLASVLT